MRKAAIQEFIEQNVTATESEPAPLPQVAGYLQSQSGGPKTSEELQLEKPPLRVRETGFWRFKTVIVPPNAYVVHTRRGRQEPVTIGLGVSFRFNPLTDAYLVVPAAMQTIGIVAKGIRREKQGINVLAYVQWLISDFSLAYRKLDFSDPRDPMAIVNAQLREQAEAAIKDKVATMSVDDVLTDKAPIIEELTERMKAVTEGRNGGDGEGLGIRVVTVQLKEALVSSAKLWENLQAPFRHQKEREARLSQLQMQEEIRQRELANEQFIQTHEAGVKAQIARTQAEKQTEILQTTLAEKARQKTLEVSCRLAELDENEKVLQRQREAERHKIEADKEMDGHLAEFHRVVEENAFALEKLKQDRRQALEREALQAQLQQEESRSQAHLQCAQRDLAVKQREQEIANSINSEGLAQRLIGIMPEVAREMPKPDEFRSVQICGAPGAAEGFDPVSGFITKLLSLAEGLGVKWPFRFGGKKPQE